MGLFNPPPNLHKPLQPGYVLPKTTRRGCLVAILIGTGLGWSAVFLGMASFISWLVKGKFIPDPRFILFYILIGLLGLAVGLLVGKTIVGQIIQEGIEAGDIKMIDPNNNQL